MIVIPSVAHKEWHEETMWALKKYQKYKFKECGIKVTFYPPTKRRLDMSNAFESLADVLVDAGILEDDNIFCVQRVELQLGGVDKDDARIEVVIHNYA